MKDALENFVRVRFKMQPDPYGYRRRLREILHWSIGLVEGEEADSYTDSIFQFNAQ